MSVRSVDNNIATELKRVICSTTGDGSALAELEQFCSEYVLYDIVKTINRRKEMHSVLINFFYKNLGNVKEWSIQALYLLVSCAVSFGNPLFEKLPQIIMQCKEEL